VRRIGRRLCAGRPGIISIKPARSQLWGEISLSSESGTSVSVGDYAQIGVVIRHDIDLMAQRDSARASGLFDAKTCDAGHAAFEFAEL
jgi:hypothetical protein